MVMKKFGNGTRNHQEMGKNRKESTRKKKKKKARRFIATKRHKDNGLNG